MNSCRTCLRQPIDDRVHNLFAHEARPTTKLLLDSTALKVRVVLLLLLCVLALYIIYYTVIYTPACIPMHSDDDDIYAAISVLTAFSGMRADSTRRRTANVHLQRLLCDTDYLPDVLRPGN